MLTSGRPDIRSEESQAVVYRSRHDVRDETELSTSILLALDSIPEFDIESSETVVFEHIDPDALNGLFRPVSRLRGDGQVTFPVDQYEVTVTAAGEITIRRRSDP